MNVRPLPLLLAATLTLAGCGAASDQTGGSTGAQSSASSPSASSTPASTSAEAARVIDTVPTLTSSAPPVDGPLVQKYGLAGKSVVEIVNELDETNTHRGAGLSASVRGDHLLLTDEKSGQEQRIPVPEGLFYMSVAPYTGQTHECVAHSLTGCVGEHARTAMDVTVTKDDGAVLYQGPITTFKNGFVGFWLPRGMTGTMSVTKDGSSGTRPISTGAADPTCNTTLRLT